MRIVQIIDSLEAGGAEKMAVSYANALAEKIEFSGLITTRAEGFLKNKIADSVKYLFANKNSTFDLDAILKCREFCVEHKIEIIQAHSTSYFLAVLIKLLLPKIKIVWHNHNGMSQTLSKSKVISLQLASYFFWGSIVVNKELENWAKIILLNKNIIYLKNFVSDELNNSINIQLKGSQGSRIICVANLRKEKNHLMLLDIANKIRLNYPEWTFHLVGKDFEDAYSKEIKNEINNRNFENYVFTYGSQENINGLLKQSDIAVLTSSLEGLPVSVLEYGKNGLAVVVTAVGELPMIIEDGSNGFLVEQNAAEEFYLKLELLIKNSNLRESMGLQLRQTVDRDFSESNIMTKYINWIHEC